MYNDLRRGKQVPNLARLDLAGEHMPAKPTFRPFSGQPRRTADEQKAGSMCLACAMEYSGTDGNGRRNPP
jgi:hypothetical protein